MTNTTQNWAAWLSASLEKRGWRQADLVRNSEGEIKRDRVSKWLSGKESPTFKLAIITANVLDASREEALAAAGFEKTAPTVVPPKDSLEDYTDEELLEELMRRAKIRGQYASSLGVGGSGDDVDLSAMDDSDLRSNFDLAANKDETQNDIDPETHGV